MDIETLALTAGFIAGGGIMYIWHIFVIRDLENQIYLSKIEGIQEGVEMSEHNIKNKKKIKKKKGKKFTETKIH